MVNIDYPEVVDRSIEAVKERDLSILEEEAKVQKELVKANGALQVATAQREVDLMLARTQRDANTIIGEGITPQFLALKQLEAQNAMATNGNAVFMPFEALNSVGAQTRMYSKE
jgi:regulator of protease activity HflC (stomatin/prohibitin superfamily)